MSDEFPVTLNRVQWHAISGMLSVFAEPAAHQLQIQILNGLKKPRADFATRYRLVCDPRDGEYFLVPAGFENEFHDKVLDGSDLYEYYTWVDQIGALTFTDPIERPNPV